MQTPDFTCHTPLPAGIVSVTFRGMFQGREVIWEMQLGTLEYFRSTPGPVADYRCPFIEIAEGTGSPRLIRVGLALAIIDEPAIRKTIIMIRNYKRLAPGKHEFCHDNG
jgi:hypothetical protein